MRRVYTLAEKEKAAGALVVNADQLRKTARELDMPMMTLHTWRGNDDYFREMYEIAERAYYLGRGSRINDIVTLASDALIKKLSDPKELKKMSAKQLARISLDYTDKLEKIDKIKPSEEPSVSSGNQLEMLLNHFKDVAIQLEAQPRLE
jgi:hypothetical protein